MSGVYKNAFMRNDISNIILQEIALLFDMMLSLNETTHKKNFSRPIFWVFVSIHNGFMCCLSFRSNEYFLIVG